MLKNWLLYLGGLACALVFHIFYFGWYSWFVLVLALCIPWFSLLVSLPAMLQMRMQLVMPDSCLIDQPVSVLLNATGGKLPMPTCRFRLSVDCCMTETRTVRKARMRGKNLVEFPLVTAHCGGQRCSAKGSLVYDYLGLFVLPIRSGPEKEILVKPLPAPPQRLPDVTRFLAKSRKPKPGGGFSEEHEMRDYRPGDNLRDIHWKLSAKTDRLIVREPQEPLRELVLLTFDLREPRTALDKRLAQLFWLSHWLLEHDVEHQILWIDPPTRQPAAVQIARKEDLQPLMHRLLCTPLRKNVPSVAEYRPSAAWRYEVLPDEEVQP